MPFAGQALEEFTGAYLREVHDYIVMVHVDYLRTKELVSKIEGKTPKQDYWSDIDVLGIKGDEAIIVSCDENCSKRVEEIVRELKYGEEYVKNKYKVKTIRKMYVFSICWAPNQCKENFKKLNNLGIEVKSFVSMVREFINKLRATKIDYTVRVGKFTDPILWVLREIEVIKTLTGRDVLPPTSEKSKRRNVLVEWE